MQSLLIFFMGKHQNTDFSLDYGEKNRQNVDEALDR